MVKFDGMVIIVLVSLVGCMNQDSVTTKDTSVGAIGMENVSTYEHRELFESAVGRANRLLSELSSLEARAEQMRGKGLDMPRVTSAKQYYKTLTLYIDSLSNEVAWSRSQLAGAVQSMDPVISDEANKDK